MIVMTDTDVIVVSKKSARKYLKRLRLSINKSHNKLSYLDSKKILRRVPRSIMKIRKYSKTIPCIFDMDDWYFRICHNRDILSVIDELFVSQRIKKNNKSWVKYRAILNLYDCEEDYEK